MGDTAVVGIYGFLMLNDKKILENAGHVSHLEMEKIVRDKLKTYNEAKRLN